MPAFLPRIDKDEPIPPYFSRYPKRSPAELQQLMKHSRETASAGTRLLRQAAQIAKLVKDDEPWIAQYTAESARGGSSSSSSSHKRSAAVAAAAAIAAASSNHNGTTATTTTTSAGLLLADGTGGHCNTNHAIPWNVKQESNTQPDVESNRVRELIRNRLNRLRVEQPESRTEERWDKPKVVGERRRRIVRDVDAPEAPSEPPPSGFTVFVSLLTTKFRHDRGPETEHSQTATVQEISRLWRVDLNEQEQQYYTKMAEEIQSEYREQMLEYRATEEFRPSDRFIKLGDGKGPWVHKHPMDRNELEAQVAAYKTFVFPPRPPSKDQEYYTREQQSKERRKERIRMEAAEKFARKRALEEALIQQGKLNRRISKRRVFRKEKKDGQEVGEEEEEEGKSEAEEVDNPRINHAEANKEDSSEQGREEDSGDDDDDDSDSDTQEEAEAEQEQATK